MATIGEGRVTYELDLSPGTAVTLDEMARRLGVDTSDVIRYGVGLLKLMLDVGDQGKGFGIIDRDGKVESRIVAS